MKKILNFALISAVALTCATSCYDDYVADFDYSSTYFSSQKPLRTVIADRDMSVKVGMAIGGKREVDANDWVKFEFDNTLLDGTSFEVLPESYYVLSNNNTLTVSNPMLAIADVKIDFTEDFYADPLSATGHYALPFKATQSSLDSILDGKQTSVVLFKYVSTYSGTYYTKGSLYQLDASGESVAATNFGAVDLANSKTTNLTTVDRSNVVAKSISVETDLSPVALGDVVIGFGADGVATVEAASTNTTFVPDSGSGSYSVENVDGEDRMVVAVSYKFTNSGVDYYVDMTFARRQDPLKDLRFEEWTL